ncbi:MAG: LamG domain-containing protein [Candidatus Binatia bacterium]
MVTSVLGSILALGCVVGCGEKTVTGPPGDNSSNGSFAAGTITFWILPKWAGDTTSDIILVHVGGGDFENHVTVFKNGRYLRVLFADDRGDEAGGAADVSGWKPGDHHLITGTWGDGVTSLYIDGVAVATQDYAGTLVLGPNPPVFLGQGQGPSSNIMNLEIYHRALTPEEVAALFTQPPG